MPRPPRLLRHPTPDDASSGALPARTNWGDYTARERVTLGIQFYQELGRTLIALGDGKRPAVADKASNIPGEFITALRTEFTFTPMGLSRLGVYLLDAIGREDLNYSELMNTVASVGYIATINPNIDLNYPDVPFDVLGGIISDRDFGLIDELRVALGISDAERGFFYSGVAKLKAEALARAQRAAGAEATISKKRKPKRKWTSGFAVDKLPGEDAEAYLVRVYGDPKTTGMIQADLIEKDPSLYSRIRNLRAAGELKIDLPLKRYVSPEEMLERYRASNRTAKANYRRRRQERSGPV